MTKLLSFFRETGLSDTSLKVNTTGWLLWESETLMCCVIICKYARESHKLFQDYTLALGSMVDILEPQFLKTSLGQDENNPIITTTKPLRAASVIPVVLPTLDLRESQHQCYAPLCDKR